MMDYSYNAKRTVTFEETRPAVRCAEHGCPDYQWNIRDVPQSKFCWKHAKAHGEVTHG